MHHLLMLWSGPKDRVSKDVPSDIQAALRIPKKALGAPAGVAVGEAQR